MKKFKIIILGAALLPLLLIKNIALGQENENINRKKSFLHYDQIKFSLSPVLYEKLTLKNYGEDLLKSRPTVSGETSIIYCKHLKNNWGINVGAGLGLASYYLNYSFDAPQNSIFYNPDAEYNRLGDINYYEYIQFMWTFPLSIQKIIEKKENYYKFEAGIKLNRVIAYPYEITCEDVYEIKDSTEAELFYFYLNSTKKNLISFFIKGGIIKFTKKQNTFEINAIINYSFSKIGTGFYRFYNLPFDSWGYVEQKINYIGIEFIYGISLFKSKFMP